MYVLQVYGVKPALHSPLMAVTNAISGRGMNIHSQHTHIHTYIHTNIHTYINLNRTSTLMDPQPFKYTYIHTYIQVSLQWVPSRWCSRRANSPWKRYSCLLLWIIYENLYTIHTYIFQDIPRILSFVALFVSFINIFGGFKVAAKTIDLVCMYARMCMCVYECMYVWLVVFL